MKIMVCGSMSYAPKIKEAKEQLEALGHQVLATKDLNMFADDPDRSNDLDEDLRHCIEHDIFRDFMDSIAVSNAVLVLNYPKNGIAGYIGTSVIIELGVAFYLRKKLFILEPLPDYHKVRWAHEVAMMQPLCLEGDVEKIL